MIESYEIHGKELNGTLSTGASLHRSIAICCFPSLSNVQTRILSRNLKNWPNMR